MAFSGETIRRKAKSLEEFTRGRELFCAGKVEFISVDSFWKGEENIKMYVEDGGMKYRVSLLIKGDCVYRASCACPSHKEFKGLCCHEVAAAFYAMEKREDEATPHITTPARVRQMIHSFTSREMTSLMAADMEEKIHLKPVLRESGGRVFLYLKIGINRFYLMKDIVAFAEALEGDSYVEYGKQLGFYHSLEAFDETSAKLAEAVNREVSEYKHIYEQLNPARGAVRPVIKELELTPGALDNFMKLLIDEKLEIECSDGSIREIEVRKENPILFGIIRTYGKDGTRISLMDEIRTFKGKKRLYIIRGDKLYICDTKCTKLLYGFLDTLEAAGPENGMAMEMSQKDLPAFCDYVLPKIKKYVSLEPMGIDLGKYHTEPLKTKFYFDTPSYDEVTLSVEFWYGEECYKPFDKKKSEDLLRDRVGEMIVGTVVKKYFHSRYVEEDIFSIRDDDEALYALMDTGLNEFSKHGEVYLSNEMKKIQIMPEKTIHADVRMNGEWLTLDVDTGDLTSAELARILAAYHQKKRFYRMRSGEFMRLADSGLGTLADIYRGFGLDEKHPVKGEISVPRYRSLYLDKILKDGRHVDVSRDSAFRSVVRNMNAVTEGDFEVPETLKDILREYQKFGFYWFRMLDACGFGGILADDMGLGKTIQVIALLLDEAKKNPNNQSIIICPASLIYNWETELQKFGESLTVKVIAGTAEERMAMLKSEEIADYQVIITSYDLLRRDIDLYEKMKFRFQIIDEAQYIKNHATQNAKAVKRISAMTKFALTGTPIENRLSDLWSIFDYLMPGFLFTYQRFRKEYEIPVVKEESKSALKQLHKMIGPFLLRRYKKDVLKELPDKLEHVVYSKMDTKQRELYAANALLLKNIIAGAEESAYQKEKIQILAELTRLRQICCDPTLCYDDYKGGSAKLETCMELVATGVESGHKILLFSQFTSMLDILEARLMKEKIPYFKLTGQTGKEERMQLVNTFNQDQTPVFLISLKAGGTGLNLTSADIVIHYDPWWNLAAQNQATDRAHRIGQKKAVSVFNLIARDTVEEGILKLQVMKKKLVGDVIEEDIASFSSFTREELIDILHTEENG